MKPTVVKFSPDHERRLRKLCIKKRFLKNISLKGLNLEQFATMSIEHKWTWRQLIYFAFVWEASPEGYTYWKGIAGIKTRKKKS